MKGLGVRLARGLNKLWGRWGRVVKDRYHDRVLKTPREVRNALVYVLHNVKKHAKRWLMEHLDEASSARVFEGWNEAVGEATRAVREAVAAGRTWLLTEGWRKRGLLSIREAPALE